VTLSQCPPYLTSYVWPASDHPRDARLSTSAKKRLHTPTNLRSHKPISHQISCHTKVSHTQENASKSRCHANKSATKSVSYKSVTHTRKCLQVKVSYKQISHQISCHGKVSYTIIHTSQSATNSNAAHRGTVPTSAIDGKVPFEEQHACGLQSLDGPSNVDGSFYKTRQWGHQAPTMCWGGLAHPISSCTSTTAGSYAQPSVPFSTSV
jgi:hypothetical protein